MARVVAPPLAPSVVVADVAQDSRGSGPFDLVSSASPRNPTTEPRIGPNHNIVFTFDKPVTGGRRDGDRRHRDGGRADLRRRPMTVPLTGVANSNT